MDMRVNIHLLHIGYCKEIIYFYNKLLNIETNIHGDIFVNLSRIEYCDYLDKKTDSVSIDDCQLEIYIDKNFTKVEQELLSIKSEIRDKKDGVYITTKDPSGLNVKLNFIDKNIIPKILIPYKGSSDTIEEFYNNLGLTIKDKSIILKNNPIEYYCKKEKLSMILTQGFELWIVSEDKAIDVKNKIEEYGGKVIFDDDGMYGRIITAKDPAGVTIVILPSDESQGFIFDGKIIGA